MTTPNEGAKAPKAVAQEDNTNCIVQEIRASYDEEGVWFYQAFNHPIADWAIENQTLGGPKFHPIRMTWVKPSFAWVLCRSGYATKHNQERILKIKIGHDAVAQLLSCCACEHGGGGAKGRAQWDPERDIMSPDARRHEPRKMQRTRSIQIGLSKELSELYVKSILCIEDVTELAHRVSKAHELLTRDSKSSVMQELVSDLPMERPYTPYMGEKELENVALLPGEVAQAVAGIGFGEATEAIIKAKR